MQYNGRPVANRDELVKMVVATKPGTSVPVKVIRNKSEKTLNVVVDELDLEAEQSATRRAPQGDQQPPEEQATGSFGLTLENVTPQVARRLRLPSGQSGAVVTDVDPDGPSAAALRAGDVILSVNSKTVSSAAEAAARAAEGTVGTHRAVAGLARRWTSLRPRQEGLISGDRRSPIVDLFHERGPITVAAFMDLALYDSEFGYYARAPRRSGRAGDFFTSVDVGALFGELLEVQIAEMRDLLQDFRLQTSDFRLQTSNVRPCPRPAPATAAFPPTILRAARRRDPAFYETIHPHLVDASAEALRAQAETLGDVGERLVSSATLPESFEGVLLANELLDAFPVHQVVMREDGLREVYVSRQSSVVSRQSPKASGLTTGDWRLTTVEGPPSTPALAEYLDRLGVTLEPGWPRGNQPARGRLDL